MSIATNQVEQKSIFDWRITHTDGSKKFWTKANQLYSFSQSDSYQLQDSRNDLSTLYNRKSNKVICCKLWKYSKKAKKHIEFDFTLEGNRLAYTKDGNLYKYRDLENEQLEEIKSNLMASTFRKGFYISDRTQIKKFFASSTIDFELCFNELKRYCILNNFFEEFIVHEILGKGRYGSVFKIESRAQRKFYAAKRFDKSSIIQGARNKIHLLTEIQILRQLNHYALPKFYGVYESLDHIYVVTDLYEGGHLCTRTVSLGCYPEIEAAILMKNLLEGVSYLHERGILHRDIKLENIVLENYVSNTNVRLIDLGLSDKVSILPRDFICGTPGYMAPECLKGQPADYKSDVFSLGIVLYCILSGTIPFQDERKSMILEKNKECNLKFPYEYWRNVSSEAIQLVKYMTSADPQKRPSINECLNSRWITQYTRNLSCNNSIGSLDELIIIEEKTQACKKKFDFSYQFINVKMTNLNITTEETNIWIPEDDQLEFPSWSIKCLNEGRYDFKIKKMPQQSSKKADKSNFLCQRGKFEPLNNTKNSLFSLQ